MNSFKWCGKRVTYLVETRLLSVIWWHGKDMSSWDAEFYNDMISRSLVLNIGRLGIYIGKGEW